ncbi:SPOR domain-containing protein [Flagellimonas sp. DF-77]|uniref:HU domain-containing protein n=1 Tax=Flagellimonas algarum TaxID=3230298 RepID=UPI003399FB02
MRIEHYISELLYRYNCVVVPEFGAFLANTTSAKIDVANHTLFPPSKSISFNQQLSKNDGLLVSHIAKSKHLAYDDILDSVLEHSKTWKERLINGDRLDLDDIGSLTSDSEGRIQFKPTEKVNYLVSSFGLSTFSATPIVRETLKQEVVEIEEKIPFIITPEQRETTSFRPLLKYAALVLLTFSLGASGYQFYRQNQNRQALVQQESEVQVEKYIQRATFFDSAPLELPPITITLSQKKEETGPRHHIIAGAFRVKANAESKVSQLSRQGYDASYIGQNRYGLHQVAYASFTDSKEGLVFLRKIKREVSADAWMLSEK